MNSRLYLTVKHLPTSYLQLWVEEDGHALAQGRGICLWHGI